MSTTVQTTTEIRSFHVDIPEEELAQSVRGELEAALARYRTDAPERARARRRGKG